MIEPRGARFAFTLVELVLVMALMAMLMAVVAPTLSRTMRGRSIDGESQRLLSLNEYARSEAASLGVPIVVWIDAESRTYGLDAKSGYSVDGLRRREYTLHPDVNIDPINNALPGPNGRGFNVAEYEPDGTLDVSSLDAVRLTDRFKGSIALALTTDHYGYEIVREASR